MPRTPILGGPQLNLPENSWPKYRCKTSSTRRRQTQTETSNALSITVRRMFSSRFQVPPSPPPRPPPSNMYPCAALAVGDGVIVSATERQQRSKDGQRFYLSASLILRNVAYKRCAYFPGLHRKLCVCCGAAATLQQQTSTVR